MTAFLTSLHREAFVVAGLELWLDMTLKATLILGFAGIVNLALRRSSAAIKHWVWSLSFFALSLMPALSLALPDYWIALSLPAGLSADNGPNRDQPRAAPDSRNADGYRELPAEQTAWDADGPGSTVPVSKQQTWSIVVLLWISGAVVLLLRRSVELALLSAALRSAERVADREWNRALRRCAGRLKVNRAITLKRSGVIAAPITFGFWRPVILLPRYGDDWSAEQRETTLLHELAHIKRWDFLSNLAAQFAQALYWYHPLAWLAKSRLQIEREKSCDDCVVTQGISACDYANHLLAVARSLPRRNYLGQTAPGMAQRSELKQRIQSILDSGVPRFAPNRVLILASAAFAVLAVLPVAAMHLSSDRKSAEGDSRVESVGRADRDGRPSVATLKTRESVTELTADLRHEDPRRRTEAALALGEARSGRALQPLIAALRDPDPEVREAAVQALGRLAEKSSFYGVVVLLKDPAPKVRRATIQTLSEIGCDPSFVAITSALKDPDPSVREVAATMLGSFREKDAEKPLMRILLEYSDKADRLLLPVLGRVEDTTVVACLEQALADESGLVRQAATRSLIKLGRRRTGSQAGLP